MINIEKYLDKVEKPSRYVGGEYNSVVKNKDDVDIRVAFCFPDTYEIGMSHLGLRCIYHVLNNIPDVWCERSFMPWTDMEEVMRKNNIPLYALESKDSLYEFDMLGFTLQYEMSYTNLLAMLDLSGIPFLSSERGKKHPIICAGGPCAVNPEPLADIVDFFMVGEGEEVWQEIIDLYRNCKNENLSKDEFLLKVANIKGVYVPKFYDVTYKEDGTIDKRTTLFDVPSVIEKRVVENFDMLPHPEEIIVPYTEIVHDRVTLEIFRGCIRGCRFCQAGFIYRPVRERAPEKLVDIAINSLKSTGYDEVSLCSLSTSDYTKLDELTDKLMEYTDDRKINFCLPSLRVDNFNLPLANKVQKVRKTSLTFAPDTFF